MKRFLLIAWALMLGWSAEAGAAERAILVGYVFPQAKVYQDGDVDAKSLDRVNFAFGEIKDGRLAAASATDEKNLAFLTGLRKQKPGFAVLISVGGWEGSGGFSDAALTAESRRIFIASAMEFLSRHDLDGLDIDWEYPGQEGAGNKFRAEDKENFTALVKELRQALDREEKRRGRHLYLSAAVGSGQDFLDHTEMGKVAKYLDTVNLMTYDFTEPSDTLPTGHHSPLYSDPADPRAGSSDASVKIYMQAGVPAKKILLGVPFYGHAWGQVADVDHGLRQRGKVIPKMYAPYGKIATEMIDRGYVRYWDAKAGVPWLYNAEKQIFVTYEDPESLKDKCRYVLGQKLGGVMFWDYEADNQGALRTVAWETLNAKTGKDPKEK